MGRREREAREPGVVYLMQELVPDEPAVPWDLQDPAPLLDNALPVIPFTPCDPDEHDDQVRGSWVCCPGLVHRWRLKRALAPSTIGRFVWLF